MTSNERHEARYKRRKAKRDEAKRKRNEGHSFDEVTDFNNLRKAFYSARKGVNWKASVQRYGSNVLKNSIDAQNRLRAGENISRGFIEFDIHERGKKRHITSVHISERVVQKSVCDYGIVPIIEKSLIYDNGASQKGKGTDFARSRLIKHLREYYRKNGADGYILMGDCHNFFGSLDHSVIENNLRHWITDERLIDLTMSFVHPFKEGLGLGSQVCQILAVSYQNKIDHAIKSKCKYYGRYMDDFYIICRTKDEAKEMLKHLTKAYKELNIDLNTRKTQIVKLSHGFKWLHDNIYLTSTGKVIDKPCRVTITRNRRKLIKLTQRLDEGLISYRDVYSFYVSHIGYLKNKDAYYTRRNFENLYNNLVIRRWANGYYAQ